MAGKPTNPTEHHINIGFDHTVKKSRIVAILAPATAPLKRVRDKAAANDLLLDVTTGRRTRSIIVTDSNHVILSAVTPETLWERYGRVPEPTPPLLADKW
jgi:regulator of extracellular matrix RemA (YlzA/DUF370 family)